MRRSVYCTASFSVCSRRRTEFPIIYPDLRLDYKVATHPTRYTGVVQDSGEGRWTIQAAIEEAISAEVLTAALFVRFRSRQEHTFAEKMLSAMRNKFGGHVEIYPGN